MTLIVAFKCLGSNDSEGIVISSDSRLTESSGLISSVHKIEAIWLPRAPECDIALLAGAGDVSIIRHGISFLGDTLREHAKSVWKNKPAPTLKAFDSLMQKAEIEIIKKYGMFRNLGLDIAANIVVATVARDGKAGLYLIDSRGLMTAMHDNPGYVCIGSGFVTGGNLLLNQLYNPNLDATTGATLSAFIINQVSKVDPAVGSFEGENWYFRMEGDRPVFGKLKQDAFKRYKADVEGREQLFRTVWEFCDTIGSEKALKVIQNALKKQRTERDG
jgi:20S proteasome alpha/beta subunit